MHPKLLKPLFFTEMWERFSFYGMRALLVLYLVNAQGYSHHEALNIYAIYTSLVYLTPILGGYIADKYLNRINSIILGSFLMMTGHFLLAFDTTFFQGLGFLIIGNGFFKPNISNLLGDQYKNNSINHRDEGFSIFYIGINLGAFLAPLIIGFIGELYNWHFGFMIAALGMLLGLFTFIIAINKTENLKKMINISFIFKPYLISSLIILIFVSLPTSILLWSTILGLIAIFFHGKVTPALPKKIEINKIKYIGILGLFSIVFWVGFEQAGGFLTIFTDTNVNKKLFDFTIPTTLFLSLNPLLIILLGAYVSKLWSRLGKKIIINTSHKIAIGLMLLSLGYLPLVLLSGLDQIHFLWIFLVYFLHTIGELSLSPTGLSMVTRVSPNNFKGVMLGVWFLTFAVASFIAGNLPKFLEAMNINLFIFIGIISFGAGLFLLLINKKIEKLL